MEKCSFSRNEGWYEDLTCPVNELLPHMRNVIAGHIASCPTCYRIVADFGNLPWFLEAMPEPQLPEGLPPKLLQLWEEEDRDSKQKPRWPSVSSSSASIEDPELSKWMRELME